MALRITPKPGIPEQTIAVLNLLWMSACISQRLLWRPRKTIQRLIVPW